MWQASGRYDVEEPSEVEPRPVAPPAPGKRTLTMAIGTGPRPVQLKAAGAPASAAAAPSPAGGGGALEATTRMMMERAFSTDFSAVRVHHDGAAEALGAAAFARGDDLHFAAGRYQPQTEAGQHLLAHELTHVVQQRSGRVAATQAFGGVLIDRDAGLEAEADAVADRIGRGEAAGVVDGAGAASGPAPIQASIDIGGNAFNALAGFKAHIAAAAVAVANQPRQAAVAANTHDVLLQAMLVAGFVYRYSDVDALLRWLEANHAAPPAAPGNAAQVAVQLAGQRSYKCYDDFADPATIATDLQDHAGWRLVLCADDVAGTTAYYDGMYALVAAQVLVCSATKLELAVAWIVARHATQQVAVGGVNGFVNNRPTIVQSPQERGDMHDIKVALALDPNLRVVFVLDDHRRRAESEDILGYYGNHARVRLCDAPYDQVRAAVPFNRRQSVGRSTEIIARQALDHRDVAERAMVEETTGLPEAYPPRPANFPAVPADGPTRIWQALDAYDADLANVGHFQAGVNYVLVNYRDSGHNVTPPRDPSHPELDTGTDGYADLMAAVTAAGFTPVPMGEPPGDAPPGPSLVRYWTWASCAARAPQQNKRQAEYGLLRRLNEQYSVRALAMRSGTTDAMVYAGIETISLDFDAEAYSPAQLANTGMDPSSASAASWRRAGKRDGMRPGKFHQGFLVEPRVDAVAPAPGAQWTGAIDPGQHPAPLPGAHAPAPSANAAQVTALIAQFFGTDVAPVRGNFELDPASPLANVDQKAQEVQAAHRDATEQARRAAAAAHAGHADAHAWATHEAGRIRNGNGGATARAAAAQAAAQLGQGEANQLVAMVGVDLAGPAPGPHLLPLQARAATYAATMVTTVARLGHLAGQLAPVVPNGATDDDYGDFIADLDSAKEAMELCEFAVKQLRNRIATDEQVRTGALQL